MAFTARRALQHPPRTRKRKGPRPQNPTWVRYSAATLVQVFHEKHPGEVFAPNASNNYTTPILREVTRWLFALGLCPWIGPRTLYDWYCEARDAGALEPLP
jgi:hypothetical protein